MRLLLDESLSARIAALLSPQGHDVAHVGDFDLLGAPDDVVLATAAREHRILVTADTDFGTLIALEHAEKALESGALVVAQHDLLRIRDLPIEPGR